MFIKVPRSYIVLLDPFYTLCFRNDDINILRLRNGKEMFKFKIEFVIHSIRGVSEFICIYIRIYHTPWIPMILNHFIKM